MEKHWQSGSSSKSSCLAKKKNDNFAGCQWFTPIILVTQEAEIRRIAV
jgi:hypothetical protein